MNNALVITALLYGLATGVAFAGHASPVPCDAGEIGAGANCMFVAIDGNQYDASTGNRSVVFDPLATTLSVEIYMNFDTFAVQGGGFHISYHPDYVSSSSWTWNTAEFPGSCPFSGEQTTCGTDQPANGRMFGIQFDDNFGTGYGGSTGSQPAFAMVGTLTLNLTGASGTFVVGINQDGLNEGTFPNCFAPGDNETGTPAGQCVPTDFYSLTVTSVPLPAAAWMLLTGLGVLVGFGRKKRG